MTQRRANRKQQKAQKAKSGKKAGIGAETKYVKWLLPRYVQLQAVKLKPV